MRVEMGWMGRARRGRSRQHTACTPQQQIKLVEALGLMLDKDGYVQIDAMKRETSTAGIDAGGDLTTRMQGGDFRRGGGDTGGRTNQCRIDGRARFKRDFITSFIKGSGCACACADRFRCRRRGRPRAAQCGMTCLPWPG